MSDLLLKIVNMSITASWLILAVIVVRLLLRKAPKWLLCSLWALVGIRLIFPISFKSIFSAVPSKETIPSEIATSPNPVINSGIEVIDSAVTR